MAKAGAGRRSANRTRTASGRGRTARNQASANPTGTLYESAAQTRRTVGWRAPTTTANTAVLANLVTLRDRSREAARNNPYGKAIIDRLVTNIVGTGIVPVPRATNRELRKQIAALWLTWTDECDAAGLLDFYGQQSQVVRLWTEAGEAFVRLRSRLPAGGLSVPLQLEVVEPELCPHTWDNVTQRIRAGIQFDGVGRRIAYYFHPSRPELPLDYDPGQLKAVPADSVIHLFDPLRAGQLRGLPILTPALPSLRELDKFIDATLLRQQIANLFVAFLTNNGTPGESTLDPLTNQTAETDENGRNITPLEPGLFQELGPGEEVSFSDPPDVMQGFADFIKAQLRGACAATGVPYEVVTGDMGALNDRIVRVILNEFRRRIMAWQHQIVAFQLCRRVWRAWFDRVFDLQVLPIGMDYLDDPTPYAAVKWSPHSWPYLHPVQDVEAQKEAIRVGLTSRTAAVSEQGEDAEEIDSQQAEDNARADALGLRYDSDGRQAATPKTGATEAPTSTAAPSPDV